MRTTRMTNERNIEGDKRLLYIRCFQTACPAGRWGGSSDECSTFCHC